MTAALRQSGIMVGRSYRLSMRNVDGLVTGLALPVLLMLVFVLLTCYQAEKVRAANRSGASAADDLDVDGFDGDYLIP